MLPSLSLAFSFPSQPLHYAKRRGNCVRSPVVCSVRLSKTVSTSRSGVSTSSALHESEIESLNKVYMSSRRYRPLSSAEISTRAEFFLAWGLSFEEISQCTSRYRPFLKRPSDSVMSLLETCESLGLSRSQIKKMLLKYPQFVRVDSQQLSEVAHYFMQDLNMNPTQFAQLLATWPTVVGSAPRKSIIPKCKYFLQDLEMEPEQFAKLVTRWPTVINLSLQKKLMPKCNFFLEEVGMDKAQLNKLLVRSPAVLGYSLERKLKPTVNYFLSTIGVPAETFSKKISATPRILGQSLSRIEALVGWMEQYLHLSSIDMRRFCIRAFFVFGTSQSNLEARVENLCRQFKWTEEQCCAFLRRSPQVLGPSIENMNTTIHYLVEVLHRDLTDIERCPSILWHSVENRIKPRYERMLSIGFPCEDYLLSRLFGTKDEAFEELMDRHVKMSS